MRRMHRLGSYLDIIKEGVSRADLVQARSGRTNTHCQLLLQVPEAIVIVPIVAPCTKLTKPPTSIDIVFSLQVGRVFFIHVK